MLHQPENTTLTTLVLFPKSRLVFKQTVMGHALFFFFLLTTHAGADECKTWFKSQKLKPGEGCLLQCVSANTDMGTFHCSNSCGKLCKSTKKTKFIFKLSNIYPALTKAERALVSKYPKKTLKAYQLSLKAEKLCLTVFAKSKKNDASDACRHFVWSALLYKQFGLKFSSQVLSAHEQNPKQPAKEKAMDTANNRLGLITAEKILKNKKKLTDKLILKAFQDSLKMGKVVVLKKSKKNKINR